MANSASTAAVYPDTPGLPSKHAAILEAATRVFLDSGYDAASMDAIAREAGVSKQTVYSHFGGKDALFGAIIREKCDELLEPIIAPETRVDDPEAALTDMARRFLELVLIAGNMALFRTVVGEWARFPELAAAFYDSGPKLALENLTAYLSELDARGVLAIADPQFAAGLFFGMLRSDTYMRRLLGIGPDPTAEDIERTVGEAVRVFLAAYARR
jgi:TetR/AcrR family transcriptional repressor of mexJK operon